MKQSRKRARQAFTLIEMIVTISVFVLLSAAVFSLVAATLQSGTALTADQKRNDEVIALDQYLRRALTKVTADDQLALLSDSGGESTELVLTQSGAFLGLAARSQANGLRELLLYRAPAVAFPSGAAGLQQFGAASDSAVPPVALLHDLSEVQWRFRVPNVTAWTEELALGASRPALVELTIRRGSHEPPISFDIWMPPMSPSQANQPGATAAPLAQ